MPNWCSNTVMIQGDPNEVEALMESVCDDSNPFSLNKIMPRPEELEGRSAPEKDEDYAKRMVELYGSADWYHWSIDNWGTKWDTGECRVISNFNDPMLPGYTTVKIEFNTAWAPPLPVYKELSKKFPNTNIYACYDEPGVDFAGYALYKNGEVIVEKQTESPSNMMYYMEPNEDIFKILT